MSLEDINCNICDLDDHILVCQVGDPLAIVVCKFNLVKCKNCGLIYLNPRPPQNEIHKYYPKSYYAHAPRRTKRKLKEIIGAHVIRGRSANVSILDKLLFYWLKNRIQYLSVKPVGRFLDIGCGMGSLVKRMQEIGWESYGIEISANAVRIAQNYDLNVYLGDLTQQNFASDFFDLINMNNVLEHVHSPLRVLMEVSRILKDNGRFYCSVPNFGCFQSQNFGKYWRALDVPRHLYFFTPDTLKYLFEKASLRILKMVGSIHKGNERLPSIRLMHQDVSKDISQLDITVKNLKELFLKPFLYALSSSSVKVWLGQQLTIETSCK